jgi:chemotaxis protein CheX
MKVEFVGPFVQAGFSVIETLLKDRAERGPLSMRAVTFTTQQITIIAGVNGDVQGAALYGMSYVTAEKIASAMIGMAVKEMDEMAWSAISELGNIITGNAVELLYRTGYKCDITPPSVIQGSDTQVSTCVPALVVPMTTKFGRLEINVALREAVVKKAA